MKAIVMAGGEGTRMRPITAGMPKPMAELFSKPILEHTLALLRRGGISEACFTLGYLPEVIRDAFGDGDGYGVNIEYCVEKTPLGTAGGVRQCREFIGDDDVIIISGDAVCDFDLGECCRFYREKKCDAAIVTYEHPSPTEYGLVMADESGRIEGFIEKPDWAHVVTNRINTGIYILPPRTVDMIPPDTPYDFGKDLFPRMLREGRSIYAAEAEGYWCDVGSPEAYRRCHAEILSGKTRIDTGAPEVKKNIRSLSPVPQGCTVIPPVFIGRNCVIKSGAVIGPETVLGDGTTVGENAAVRRSVLNGVTVGERCEINEAVIGRGTSVGAGTEICFGAVVGDGCRIGDGALIESGVRIWPKREIWSGRRVTENVTDSSAVTVPDFGADGVLRLGVPVPLTPAAAAAIGAALAKYGTVGIAFAGDNGAVLAESVGCGIRASGGESYIVDAPFEASLAAAAEIFALPLSCFIRVKGAAAEITLYDPRGLDVSGEVKRKVCAALGDTPHFAGADAFGEGRMIEGAERAYIAAAVKCAERWGSITAPCRISAGGRGASARTLIAALSCIGCTVSERRTGTAHFEISPDGRELYAEDERGRSCDDRATLMLAAAMGFDDGEKVIAVPESAPASLENMAAERGGRIVRAGRGDRSADELLARQRFMTDGIFRCLTICSAMARRGVTLGKIYDAVPHSSAVFGSIETPSGGAAAMRRLARACGEMSAELSAGLTLTSEKGCVRVRPFAGGRALSLTAEAATDEAAEELCADLRRRINKLL